MRSMVSSSRSIHDAQSWTACVGRSGGRCASSGLLRVCPKSSWANAPICTGPTSAASSVPVRPEAQHADPRVTGPRRELGGTLRRDCCAASTSEVFTLRGHGCAFLAPSTSVIEGSCDISEVDIHLCRGCVIAAPESLASCRATGGRVSPAWALVRDSHGQLEETHRILPRPGSPHWNRQRDLGLRPCRMTRREALPEDHAVHGGDARHVCGSSSDPPRG